MKTYLDFVTGFWIQGSVKLIKCVSLNVSDLKLTLWMTLISSIIIWYILIENSFIKYW